MSKIKTLFEDSAKQTAIYPRTKRTAISDENGNTMGNVGFLSSVEKASGISVPTIGVEMDLLWTNPSPTTSFAAQTISLDLMNYKIIYIVFNRSNSNATFKKGEFIIIGEGSFPTTSISAKLISRTLVTNTLGITFNDGNIYNTYAVATTDNEKMIPYKIYGIKGVINENSSI